MDIWSFLCDFVVLSPLCGHFFSCAFGVVFHTFVVILSIIWLCHVSLWSFDGWSLFSNPFMIVISHLPITL